MEIIAGEIGFVLREINSLLRDVRRWSRSRRVGTPFLMGLGRSRIVREPWNHPVQLSLVTVEGAPAADPRVSTVRQRAARGSPRGVAAMTHRNATAILPA